MPTGVTVNTVEIAQRRAQAAEVVALETKSMKEPGKEDTRLQDEEVNMLSYYIQ